MKFASHEGFFWEDFQFYDYLSYWNIDYFGCHAQHKALLSGNYCVNLGLQQRCSHSISLIARPYPICNNLEENS